GRSRSCGWRIWSLVAGFAAPSALTSLVLGLSRSSGPWLPVVMVVAPSLAAAGLVSFSPPPLPADAQQPGWTQVALGVALTVVVAMGQPLAKVRLEQARHSAKEKSLAAYPPVDPNLPYRRLFFQRGVNLTIEQQGGYGSEQGREILESLPRYSINAVALVPYGFTRRGPTTTIALGSLESDDVI